MVLGKFLSTDKVKAAHLVSLDDRLKMGIVGLSPADVWDRKNGLLLCTSIEKAYDAFEVVILIAVTVISNPYL